MTQNIQKTDFCFGNDLCVAMWSGTYIVYAVPPIIHKKAMDAGKYFHEIGA